MTNTETDVIRLVEAIVAKLNANRPELAKSLGNGRLTWRVKDGRIELSLNLSL